MIFRQPIFTIARILTTFILRSTGLNSNIATTIVMSTFGLISQIYSKYGFLTSLQSIYTIFSFLRHRENINTNLINRVFLNNHPDIKTMFLQYLVPHWSTISNYRYRLMFVLSSLFSTSVVALFRPLWLLRFSFGIILSSLGILWHETLSAYDYLRKGALYIVYLLDDYGFQIPIPSIQDIHDYNNNHSSIYTVLGVLLLGTLGIAISIIFLEYYIPPMTEPIPYTYWDRFYSFFYLDYLNIWYLTINEVLYEYYPNIYEYFFTPMKDYLIAPTWKYGISTPFNFSYDYIFHPCADGIRFCYGFIYNFLWPDPRSPASTPLPPSPMSSIDLNDARIPKEMSDSTSTIKPARIFRVQSNNPFLNNTVGSSADVQQSFDGLFTPVGQSSKTTLEDMEPLMNPFANP